MRVSSISKKIFSWTAPFIVASLIIPSAFFGAPKKADAQVPVIDGPHTSIGGQNATVNTLKQVKEFSLDMIVTQIAKTLIKQISRSTIQWINSGFQGSPAFIENPGQFFQGVADRIAGQFIEQLGLGFLCEPFRLNLQLSLALEYGGGDFTDEIGCTLSDVIGNVEGFIQGDFTQGGWDNWFAVTQNRNNNPYGAYIQAKTALDIRIATAQGEERMVLDWGDGFKSLTDGLGNILTPGATIEATLSETLGTDLRQLELADEINEIMGALVGQMMSQVMSATGLAGAGRSGSSFNSNNCDDSFCTNSSVDSQFGSGLSLVNDAVVDSTAQAEETVADAAAEGAANTNSFVSFGGDETGVVNIARGKRTAQSGTFSTYESKFAVDGQTLTARNMNFQSSPNTAITPKIINPFWQVEVETNTSDGTLKSIKEISIYRETSAVLTSTIGSITSSVTAIGNFRIFISDSPFIFDENNFTTTVNGIPFDPVSTPVTPAGIEPANGIFATPVITHPTLTTPLTIPINRTGRFVRIQRVDGLSELHLIEVEAIRNNKPVITPVGSATITVEQNLPYTDQGATAFDQSDADLGVSCSIVDGVNKCGIIPVITTVKFNNTPIACADILTCIDTTQIGTYSITYTATDSGGAVATKTRTVNIIAPRQ